MKGSSHAKEIPDEFRRRAVALIRAGASVPKTADDLGITSTCLYNWLKQDRIDRGEIPGMTTGESRALRKARRRIRELEDEVEVLRRANAMLGSEARRPKGSTR
jgi:transposase